MTTISNEPVSLRRSGGISDDEFAAANWMGPPLLTLLGADFEAACRDLMRLAERHFAPTLIVGIRTGGLVVAEAMAAHASAPVSVLPLTCRRATTATKARVPLLRTVLGAMPRPVLDMLRRVEHRYLTTGRTPRPRPQEIDHAEVAAIADAHAARILLADDAVDSGATLATVLELLRAACAAGTQLRTAAITQTTRNPVVRPDYVLHRGTLCRFPWSFDAAG